MDLDHFYQLYLDLTKLNVDAFRNDLDNQAARAAEEAKELNKDQPDELEKVLLAASLVHMSNLYRKAAERIVDDVKNEADQK